MPRDRRITPKVPSPLDRPPSVVDAQRNDREQERTDTYPEVLNAVSAKFK